SNSVSTPQVSKGVNNAKVIAPGMFRIGPDKSSREAKKVPNTDVISKVVYAMCKKYLISVNHDKCLRNYVNGKNSCGKNQKAKISVKEIQKKYQPKVTKPKNVGTRESLATPKPRKSRFILRWSPTGKLFDTEGKIVDYMSSIRTPQQNGVVERRNQTLVEAARTMFIFSRALLFLWAEAIATGCFTQNRSIIHRRFNKTPYELINGRNPDISFLHVFGALCYPKNDREDIGKLGAKGNIGFFIGYSADSCAFRVYNRRTKKIIETMNVTFDELSIMAFEQSSSKPRLQSITSGQISSGLNLTYAPSTITSQQPTEGELDLLFKAMYDDYIGGQPSALRTVLAAQAHQIVKEAMADPAWIESMQEELLQFKKLDNHFFKGTTDPTLFIRRFVDDILVVQVYIGDIIFGSSHPSVGTPMATKHLDADLSGTPVDQTKYPCMVGALMYLTASRLDIMHATCYCARYQAKQTEKHLTAVIRIFRYLKDTIHMGLWYPKDTGFELTAFSDSDHAGCLDSRKSTSGGIQFLGGDKLVSWSSKKQDCTSMSSAEAEYVSLSACCAQVLWMRTQLTDYGFHFDKISMYCDSMAAIAISCNLLADLFTKALAKKGLSISSDDLIPQLKLILEYLLLRIPYLKNRVHLLQSQKKELELPKVIAEAEVASMKAKPSYPDINQLTELLIIGLYGEIKELKQHIKDMEIELPGDLKEISSKVETFTSTISNLSS
nr:hypothetical protein [Tanacetum cinerariifolium]